MMSRINMAVCKGTFQLSVVCAAIVTLSIALSSDVLASPIFTLRAINGEPALVDSTYGHDGGYNPSTRALAGLAFNTDTGILYGMDSGGSGSETSRFDPTFEYEKGTTFVQAGTGTTRTFSSVDQFLGSVAGAAGAAGGMLMGVTYDPYMMTNGTAGVITMAQSGGIPKWYEFIPQTASDAIGALDEGTVPTPNHTSARVTKVQLAAFGGGYGAGHWQGLAMDAVKGQFMADDGDGDRLVSRYFMGKGQNNFMPVVVVNADAARTAEPTATTEGTRDAFLRNKATSNSASNNEAILVTESQFAALVVGPDDVGYDMAQNPVTGDLYFLSADMFANTFLTAITPVIPDDSSLAMSFTQVDLDPDSANDFIDLSAIHADLGLGGGITFNGDGSILYVSVTSTSLGAVKAVYALDVLTEVPEPSTAMLIALGMLGVVGLTCRRRR